MFYKLIALFCFVLICNAPLWGQTKTQKLADRRSRERGELLKKLAALATPINKTTVQKQRLVAQTRYTGDTSQPAHLYDTMTIHYTGQRGSAYDFERLMDLSFFIPPGGNSIYGRADSMRQFLFGQASFLRVYRREYNTLNQLLETQQDGYKYVVYYNSQNQIDNITTLDFNTTGQYWDTAFTNCYFYDTDGRLMEDSLAAFSGIVGPYRKVLYNYNSNGTINRIEEYDVQGTSWVGEFATDFYYLSPSQRRIVSSVWSGGGWTVYETDTLNYQGNQLTSYLRWNTYLTYPISLVSAEYRRLNLNGLPDSISYISGGCSELEAKETIIQYNGHDNPEMQYSITWTNGTSDTVLTYYYYEMYEATGVDEATLSKKLEVYPNPAKDDLYIEPGQLTGNRSQMTIVNNLGQVVYECSITNNKLIAVPIRYLQTGTYWLSVQDGKELYKASFIKQ